MSFMLLFTGSQDRSIVTIFQSHPNLYLKHILKQQQQQLTKGFFLAQNGPLGGDHTRQ